MKEVTSCNLMAHERVHKIPSSYSIYVYSLYLAYMLMLPTLFTVFGAHLWQCYSATYRPNIVTTAFWVIFCISVWMKTFPCFYYYI